jgi:sulfhydrogenase subunit beta (sulfur reductase)
MTTDDIEQGYLPRRDFSRLLTALGGLGYRCVGPVVRDGAIAYELLTDIGGLPAGINDDQQPGRYRLATTDSPRLFDWANGPQALKPWLFSARECLWTVQRASDGSLSFAEPVPDSEPTAVIGVRACDLAALALQDRHFLAEGSVDASYVARRRQLLLVAVNCTHPAATCFCASTGDGPAARDGYDLLLDELDDGYLVAAGSVTGDRIVAQLPLQPVTAAQRQAALQATDRAAAGQTRALPARHLQALLFGNLDHPRWEAVAGRCLSCGNCTSVCPTCFCYREADQPALDAGQSSHFREWDSCFSRGHSYIHDFTIRSDTRLRYRQWLTHKLGSWHDQYGRSGCVGCGRCITWCPTGIDLTAEVAAIAGAGP